MGTQIPKQYILLSGIPILAHTLRAFQGSPVIDEILLIVPDADMTEVRQSIVEKFGFSKVGHILPGGAERQDSVCNALQRVGDEHEIIVIHDAVRPFVSENLIGRAVAAVREFGAITVGVPVKDTIKKVSAEGWVKNTVVREGLWLTQTPQAFRRPIILAAYKKAAADGFYGTDDAGLVERMGIPVRMIPGENDNIKLTTAEDLLSGERIIRCSKGAKIK
jgi:2-C-methyl-D-erythritol 4-phosphate cytidylyltransferase